MWSQAPPPPAGPPPPMMNGGGAGKFRPPPPPQQQSYHQDDAQGGSHDDDSDDGALGATINLVTSAASMFFKAAAAPPPARAPAPAPPPAPLQSATPVNRGPPPPIEPPSSMLETMEPAVARPPIKNVFSAPAQAVAGRSSMLRPPTTVNSTFQQRSPWPAVPSSPLANSSPRVFVSQTSPITSAVVAQISVPSLGGLISTPSRMSPAVASVVFSATTGTISSRTPTNGANAFGDSTTVVPTPTPTNSQEPVMPTLLSDVPPASFFGGSAPPTPTSAVPVAAANAFGSACPMQQPPPWGAVADSFSAPQPAPVPPPFPSTAPPVAQHMTATSLVVESSKPPLLASAGRPPMARSTPPSSPRATPRFVPPSPSTPLRSNSQSSIVSSTRPHAATPTTTTANSTVVATTPTTKRTLPTPGSRPRQLRAPPPSSSSKVTTTTSQSPKFRLPPPRNKRTPLPTPTKTTNRVISSSSSGMSRSDTDVTPPARRPELVPTREGPPETPPMNGAVMKEEEKNRKERLPASGVPLLPVMGHSTVAASPRADLPVVVPPEDEDPPKEEPSPEESRPKPQQERVSTGEAMETTAVVASGTSTSTAPSSILPEGWMEAADPSSGRLYFYNATTQETSWDRPVFVPPAMTSPRTEGPNPETIAPPEEEVETTPSNNDDEDNKAAAVEEQVQESPPLNEESAVLAVVDTRSDPLPLDWVDVTDHSSGTVYYYNAATQETSWERPTVPEAPSTVQFLLEQQQQQELFENTAASLTAELGVEDANPPDALTTEGLDDTPVLPMNGGKAFKTKNESQPPSSSGAQPELEVASPSAMEPESTPPSAEETKTSPLPMDWTKAVDPTSGKAYYYNTITQETSWERPTIPEPPSTLEFLQEQQQQQQEAFEESVAIMTGELDVEDTLPTETPITEEATDISPPTNAEVSDQLELEKVTEVIAQVTEPESDLALLTTLEPESTVADTTTSEVFSSTPADWTEAVDPSSGNTYFYNAATEETSWERPTIPEPPSTMELLHKDAAAAAAADRIEDTFATLNAEFGIDSDRTTRVLQEPEMELGRDETNEKASGAVVVVSSFDSEYEWPASPESAPEDMSSVAESEDVTAETADVQKEPLLPDDWTEMVESTTGNVYYYNAGTQETSWERPIGEIVPAEPTGVEDPHVPEPGETLSQPASHDIDEAAGLQSIVPTSFGESSLPEGWTQEQDPSTYKTYYYNTLTQETSWNRPSSDAEIPPPGEDEDSQSDIADTTMDEMAKEDNKDAQGESRMVNGDSTGKQTDTTQTDWIETSDPSTGQIYYYNTVTQATSWGRPAGISQSEGAPDHSREAQEALETIEQTEESEQAVPQRDDTATEVETAEILEDEVAKQEGGIKSEDSRDSWVETSDPTTGQVYFYNQSSGETSWERPVVQLESDDELAADNEVAAAKALVSKQEGSNPLQNELETVETKDLVSKQEGTTPLQNEPGTVETKNMVSKQEVAPPLQNEPETKIDEPIVSEQGQEAGADDLLEGWVEASDPSTGQVYYYNTVTETTSWDRPDQHLGSDGISVDEKREDTAEHTSPEADVLSIQEEPETEAEEATEVKALPNDWVEAMEPSTGQIYFYNSSTGETSWELPEEDNLQCDSPEDPVQSMPEIGEEQLRELGHDMKGGKSEAGFIDAVEEATKREHGGVIESEELPDGWVEDADPTTGQVIYYNSLTGVTSREKPEQLLPEHAVQMEVPEEAIPETTAPPKESNDTDILEDELGILGDQNIAVDGPVAIEEDDLPGGWVEATDSSTGQVYYYNSLTGETAWERPGPRLQPGGSPNEGDESLRKDQIEPKTSDTEPLEMELEEAEPVITDRGDLTAEDIKSEGWVEVSDSSTGQFYFYNTVTQETSWERPEEMMELDELSGVEELTEESEQSAPEIITSVQLQDASEKEGNDASAPEPIGKGLTSWERPKEKLDPNEAAVGPHIESDPPALEREDGSSLRGHPKEDEKPFELVDAEANSEDDLPDDWVETSVPSTGDVFYYNSSTGLTSWEKPECGQGPDEGLTAEDGVDLPQQAVPSPVEISLPAPTIDDKSKDTHAAKTVSDGRSSHILPEFWTEAEDPDSGRTYYFNSLTQETSWKPPEGSTLSSEEIEQTPKEETVVDDTVHADNKERMERKGNMSDTDSVRSNSVEWDSEKRERDVLEDGGNESTSGSLPLGWSRVDDPQSGQEYYFNETTGETSWDVPSNQEAKQADESEEEIDATDQGEVVDASNNDAAEPKVTAGLPQGWDEVIDETTGDIFYFNEETGETSWDPPLQDEDSSEGTGPSSTPSSTTKVPKPSEENGLREDWVEIVDPASGELYYVNERDNTTSWEKPDVMQDIQEEALPEVNSAAVEDALTSSREDMNKDQEPQTLLEDWVEVVDPQTGGAYYFNEKTDETRWEKPVATIESSSVDEPEARCEHDVSLPSGWMEVVDPSGGTPYYYNEVKDETSWKRPKAMGDSDALAFKRQDHGSMGGAISDSFLMSFVSEDEMLKLQGEESYDTNMVINIDHDRNSSSVTGPLIEASDSDVFDYIDRKSKASESDLLWKLIAIAARCKGRLRSDDGVLNVSGPESAVVKLLLSSKTQEKAARPTGDFVVRQDNYAIDKEECAKKVQDLLLQGKRREAVEEAIASHDYATALLVGTMCDPDTYKRATMAFAENAFFSGSPMHTVAMLFSGGIQASSAGAGHWGVSASELKSTWKQHLAGIISNRIAGWDSIVLSLGDRLREIGDILGAHFCYIVCGCPVASPLKEGTRICLLGCDHISLAHKSLVSVGAMEAYDRMEAYEWAKRQGNRRAILKSFQPFKVLFAAHLVDNRLDARAIQVVKSLRKHLCNIDPAQQQGTITLDELFQGDAMLESAVSKLEARLDCTDSTSSDAPQQKGIGSSRRSDTAAPISNMPLISRPAVEPLQGQSRHLDQASGAMDATFLTAKSNLMDVTGYTVDSPTNQHAAEPQPTSRLPLAQVPLSGVDAGGPPPMIPMTPQPKQQMGEQKPPAMAETPIQASPAAKMPKVIETPKPSVRAQKPKAAPSTAPSVMMGKKASKNRGTAPSSSEKKGGWSLRQRLVKWINPDATEVNLPDNEEKPYYDETRKVWVFPGDNPAELVKPIAAPPTMIPAAQSQPAPESNTPQDPLAAMMAPPKRGPSSARRPGSGTPRGYPGMMPPGMSSPAPGMSSPAASMAAPPQFAVFQPKPASKEDDENDK